MTTSRSHPNAHILAQLAEIAKTNDKPWKRLETSPLAWAEFSKWYRGGGA